MMRVQAAIASLPLPAVHSFQSILFAPEAAPAQRSKANKADASKRFIQPRAISAAILAQVTFPGRNPATAFPGRSAARACA